MVQRGLTACNVCTAPAPLRLGTRKPWFLTRTDYSPRSPKSRGLSAQFRTSYFSGSPDRRHAPRAPCPGSEVREDRLTSRLECQSHSGCTAVWRTRLSTLRDVRSYSPNSVSTVKTWTIKRNLCAQNISRSPSFLPLKL